ncbi:MAG: TatD family hydrolase [Chloroflexota bacterium]
MIDTHCHLDAEAFRGEVDDLIRRASSEGVKAMVTIGIDPESWMRTREIVREHPQVVRAAGLHPTSVGDFWSGNIQRQLRDEIAYGDLVAIGETGIDLYRDERYRDEQIESFRLHLNLSQEANLPVIIHQRQALADVLACLDATPPNGGVLHCFSGDSRDAENCLHRGLHLGIGGIVTFPSATDLQEAVVEAPLHRILLETDSPYLAPQPWRGKRNEPAYVSAVAAKIAELKKIPVEDVVQQTSKNAVRLFGPALAEASRGNGRDV